MGDVDDVLHVVDGTKRVVHMSNADKPCARRDEALELREYQVAVLVGGDGTQRGSTLLAHTLPGHDICVVVEF